MVAPTPTRSSARKRKTTNYALSAAFKDLAGSDEEDDGALNSGGNDDDDDDADGDSVFEEEDGGDGDAGKESGAEGEDDDGEEGWESEVGSSEFESGEEDADEVGSVGSTPPSTPAQARRKGKAGTIAAVKGTPRTTATISTASRPTKSPVKLRGTKKPKPGPDDPKYQDPSVRVTYRQGIVSTASKKDKIQQIYGVHEEELVKAVRVRDRAMGVPAIPTRESLGVAPWERTTEEDEEEEKDTEGPSYEAQRAQWVEIDEVMGYLPEERERLKVYVGPIGNQKVVTFARFGVHTLDDNDDEAANGERNGAMFHAGGAVVGLDWCPHRPEGAQYLAVSALSEDPLFTAESAKEKPVAYQRQPEKSCIQIWRFPVGPTGKILKPSLALVLCHPWGTARDLSWCQMYRPKHGGKELGYLAACFADGDARVLHVTLPEDDDDTTGFSHMHLFTTPSYHLTAPHPITALSFLSPTSIACGTSLGFLLTFPLTTSPAPDPTLFHPLHQTYITHLTTCHPSFPTYILTNSLDGFSRITSLDDPDTDFLTTPRSRLAPTSIVYIPSLHSAATSEEASALKLFPLRRFFSSTSIASHRGLIRSLAASRCHSCLLSGGSEGEAVFSNPARRLFHSKVKNYQVTWFLAEWSALVGALRVVDGFKMEEAEHAGAAARRAKGAGAGAAEKGVQVLLGTYPDMVRVEKVAWNCNVDFGGWASAGLGCGLVRVEDVAC